MKRLFYLRAALLAALPLPGLAQTAAQSATQSANPAPASLSGDWTGSLGSLTATFHLQDPPGGPRAATLDIPVQRAKAVPLTFVVRADSVYLTLPAAAGRFAGRRAPDGQHLAGEWQQAGQTLPLTLSRGTAAAPKRPQTPQPPFPYVSQNVTFTNPKAGITLAGTYTRPAGRGPFMAVALLTGSGPEDRDETLFGHQPFAVLADYLSRRGVAVLRFDDRGVGQSGGSLAGTTSADYATDALAALAWLRARPEIRKNRVGLVGHSEGGTAAITAATQPRGGPDMLVLLAAPGLPGDELIVQQALALTKLQTSDAGLLATTEKLQRQVLAAVTQNPDNEQARARLLPLLNPGGATDAATLARVKAQIGQLTSPGYRALLADRPAQTLPLVKCPVLALNGAKDVQVVAAPNLAAIRQGLVAGGNRRATVRELSGLNHLFQTAPTGSPAEYGQIEETFAPAALRLIGDWLTARGELKIDN